MEKDNRKRYEIECPECGKILWACKSLFQEMGMLDAGHGSCMECGTFLNLTLDKENDRMIAIRFEEYKEKKLKERAAK
ncbi:hypothetical protein EUAN_12520 [Andreesenia angusta]|uniref:Uncharacterized protein n=1 Tax=Andreesenia angusta TaxID=39480 RepID=A0A1S1V6C2_9FIRM|nr:hypothetical protein [Andreesenia angusta]OHW62183.1 hypothetical protein EUAN_12520 [Andreesenia angusta]